MKTCPTQWITALRSGEYKQIKGCLHTEQGHCCLGVKLQIEGTKWTPVYIENSELEDHTEYATITEHKDDLISPVLVYRDEYSIILPPKGKEFSKDGGLLPFPSRDEGFDTLASLNDEGFTFDQIADLVECFWAHIK